MNCLVLYEYDEKSVIWDCVLTNKRAEWEVSDFDFFFHEARILPSAVGRTCTAEIVLLVTVPAYKWKPSACKVCFSLNIVTLGETVGKTVHMESASGYFRQRRPTRKGTSTEMIFTLPDGIRYFRKRIIHYVPQGAFIVI